MRGDKNKQDRVSRQAVPAAQKHGMEKREEFIRLLSGVSVGRGKGKRETQLCIMRFPFSGRIGNSLGGFGIQIIRAWGGHGAEMIVAV